jgi:hypothetical protein
MKFNKNNSEELNSGLLYFGKKKTVRNSKKTVTGNEFLPLGKLKYKLKSFKYDDFTSYFGIETKVDIKVKVYRVNNLDKSLLIRIKNDYYDIAKMDDDPTGRFTFLYLQKRSGLDD